MSKPSRKPDPLTPAMRQAGKAANLDRIFGPESDENQCAEVHPMRKTRCYLLLGHLNQHHTKIFGSTSWVAWSTPTSS